MVTQILFIEAPIGDDALAEISRNVADFSIGLKIYKSSTKRLHKTRKRALRNDGLTISSYMVWNKQSLQDGMLTVRTYYDIFSTRLPVEVAVMADYNSQAGYVRLENFSC